MLVDPKTLSRLSALETEMNDAHKVMTHVIDFMSEPVRNENGLTIDFRMELFNGKQALYTGTINHKPMAIVAEYDRGKGKFLLPYGYQVAFALAETLDDSDNYDFIGFLVKHIDENELYRQLL